MLRISRVAGLTACAALISACGLAASAAPPHLQTTRIVPLRPGHGRASVAHVIVMVQENRTVDNLFQTLPGADTRAFGFDSHGNAVRLTKAPLGSPYDPDHSHKAFVTECNAVPQHPAVCRMNGFDKVFCAVRCPPDVAYTYVDPSDIKPYLALATQYAFADEVLQPNEGPSQPGHVYLIAGQAGSPGSHWYMSENAKPPTRQQPSDCLADASTTVLQIDMTTPYPGVEGNPIYPCIDPPTIFDELDQAGIEWRYYTPSLGSIWTAPLAIHHLTNNPADYARVVTPETTILGDIQNHALQPVSYVIPNGHNSDHAGRNKPTGGPTWVASVVNAIGNDPTYWSNTVILVVWDDWGGFFDHVRPVHAMNPFGGVPDPYEYGFRVPLLAVGGHVKEGYISHTKRSSAAILHFIEDLYGLPSLGTLDAQTDDLADLFTANRAPRPFRHIPTGNVTIQKLLQARPDPSTPVDSD